MNRIQNKIKLKNKENQALEALKYYEMLENMVKNSDEGKTPKMFSYDRDDLVKWLDNNKEKNNRIKQELESIREQLKNL